MKGMGSNILKGILGTAIFITALFFVAHTTQAQTSPWDTGSITVNNASVTPYSNGAQAVFVVRVTPPVNDADGNSTIDDTSTELGSWMYIDGKAGVPGASGSVNRVNSRGFAVQVSTDQYFTTGVITHYVDVNTNVASTVVRVNIAPPTDDPLTPGTQYYLRVVGYSPSQTVTHALFNKSFTTLAAGNDLSSTSSGNGTNGNQIVGNGTNLTANDLDAETGLPECGIMQTSKVFGCIGQIFYYILFRPSSMIMVLAGEIMDWGIGYSISSSSYPVSGHSFVTDGWRIMRDIANICFIFILVYVAISTILGQDKKKLIAWVILVALVINFSLLLTKVVVDFGNITSRFFYNNISIVNPQGTGTGQITGASGHKSISYGFTATFNPIKLFAGLSPTSTITTSGGTIQVGLSDTQFASYFAVFSIVGAIVNLVAAFVFFSLAWLFIARTVGIWLSMIFAPFAFLSLALPSKINIGGAKGAAKYMEFGAWWSNLTSLAIMPAVAMIMMFLVLTFLKSNFLGNIPNETTIGQFVGVIMPLLIVAYLLMQTKETAQSMAGDFGGMMSKVGGFVGGTALGLATGGTAFLARKSIGAGAARLAESERFKNFASKNYAGRKLLTGTRNLSNASFDARNIKINGKDLQGATGFQVGKVTSKGYLDDKKSLKTEQKKFAESLTAGTVEKQKLKQLENEVKRKTLLRQRGEVDPYTGKIPSEEEIKKADEVAKSEKNRLDSVNNKRRENFAQQVEQGSTVAGRAINRADRAIRNVRNDSVVPKLQNELDKAETESKRLTGVGAGNIDPTTGKVVTQTMIDKAQGEVTDVRYRISQRETGKVGSFDNTTAEEIRSKTKDKKNVKEGDLQSLADVQEEKLKESEERNKKMIEEMFKNIQGGQPGGGNPNTNPNGGGNNPSNPSNPNTTYSGTGIGFKPNTANPANPTNTTNQNQTQQRPIGYNTQSNANISNYGANSGNQQKISQSAPLNNLQNLSGVDDYRKFNSNSANGGAQINSASPINITNSKINITTTGGVSQGNQGSAASERPEIGFNRKQDVDGTVGFKLGGNTEAIANKKAEVASNIGKQETQTSAQVEPIAKAAPQPAPNTASAATPEPKAAPAPQKTEVRGFFGGNQTVNQETNPSTKPNAEIPEAKEAPLPPQAN